MLRDYLVPLDTRYNARLSPKTEDDLVERRCREDCYVACLSGGSSISCLAYAHAVIANDSIEAVKVPQG
jgi:hypothetical protein